MRLNALFLILFSLGTPFYFCGCKKRCQEVTPLYQSWDNIAVPYSGNLLRLDFPSPKTGYICGTGGIVLKTINEGTSFSKLNSGTNQDLYGIDFVDNKIGFIGGNGSTLIKTIDGGNTWINLSIGITSIRGIYFFNANIGFVCGINGLMMKTTDGGLNWINVNSGTTTEDITQIVFADNNVGYLSGLNGYIAKTIDGGLTWNQLTTGITFSGTINLLGLSFVNSNLGFTSGGNLNSTESYILKTTDGGSTWARLSPPHNGVSYTSIKFSDPSTGYAVGGYANNNSLGYIIKTIDGGNSWSTVYTSNSNRLYGFQLINSQLTFAVGFNTSIIKGY